ncbi:hypothetical protein NZNM25_02990 [Nitrosopumilus zosterae]|uniref:Uncharacterized protein n=1 Tax=Nitrosopumilus zosterae TaxID=718286 RepID=A0A2S2KPW9_9ARCH|nr:hypothetical protein [Nitrosopumilus zosterae]BDQ31298.1 hypothetical protein NZOSNM25_001411 [Nitrosopumilus zosterae]GBH33508.1 hypothetical protein NZNM25_02990 [Nitrosopumilus zosterae]
MELEKNFQQEKINQKEVIKLPVSVIDEAANKEKMITHAVNVIGRSQDRLKVFESIYFHKSPVKTQDHIQNETGLKSLKRVLEVGNSLVSGGVIEQTEKNKRIAYGKIPFYKKYKTIIIQRVHKKQFNVPSELSSGNGNITVTVNLKNNKHIPKELTVDDIDSFSKVKKIGSIKTKRIPEEDIKQLLKAITKEDGKFVDWGGEINDINTTRLKINGKRINTSFALKGAGTPPTLTIKKMGKHGDQISRLFKSPSQAFFVMYDAQIDHSILDMMKSLAENKSNKENKMIYYGVIDGQDTARLFRAYSKSKI